MHVQSVLLAIFVQVTLTFALMFALAFTRVRAVSRKEVRARDIALGQPNWPEHQTKLGNAFRNQFELPVLFYLICVLAIITRQADNVFVVLAWLFVAARLMHAFVHVTSNNLSTRFYAFALSGVVLLLMWIVFAIDVIFGL